MGKWSFASSGRRYTQSTHIWLGWYLLGEVVIPANLTELDKTSIIVPNISFAKKEPDIPNLLDMCSVLHCSSERPNTINGHPGAHPPLHIFTFILGKYFDYQFDELAFEVNVTPHPVAA